MLNAKLIKALEKNGFFLEFPNYNSNEEMIAEIIKSDNSRILFSLPLLLMNAINYKRISLNLDKKQKREFNKAILISAEIYRREDIDNLLSFVIKKNKILGDYPKNEFKEYYSHFKDSRTNIDEKEKIIIKKQLKLRLNLDLNKSLKVLFSPAKIRIMNKIFNHHKLTNTELKYYYKSISNINKSVLNEDLRNYLKIIQIAKKSV
ncbi:MAG: hypothetical protein AABX85_01100 [Nanoarchaeota archaeon]